MVIYLAKGKIGVQQTVRHLVKQPQLFNWLLELQVKEPKNVGSFLPICVYSGSK